MTADIEAIRARIANVQPFVGFGFATSQITMDTADVEALCDEVESLRQTLLQRTAERDFHITEVDELSAKLEDFTEAVSGARAEMEDHGRSLGHALVKEIQDHFATKRKLWEAEARVTWVEEVSGGRMSDLTDARDREAELTADLYELRQQRREAAGVQR